jgi:hypothetical protein
VTRHLPALLAAAAAAAGLWQLNRKLTRQHAARMAQAAATHRAVTAAIAAQDTRVQRLLADVKTTQATRRRGRLWPR